MKRPPRAINDLPVLFFTPIDWRHTPTDATIHTVAGEPFGPAAGLAICQDPTSSAVYLLYCDDNWEPVTDTWHENVQDAKEQAEFEYSGTQESWESMS